MGLFGLILCALVACSVASQVRFFNKKHLENMGEVDGKVDYGLLMIRRDSNSSWGTLCDDHFNDFGAHVVCRQMGYNHGGFFSARRKYNKYRQFLPEAMKNNTKILLDDLECNGAEDDIDDCRHRPWGSHNCGHNEDVTVACFNAFRNSTTNTTTSPPHVRTMMRFYHNYHGYTHGRRVIYGLVMIRHNHTWGTICDDHFDRHAALVLCRSKGYRYAVYGHQYRHYRKYLPRYRWNSTKILLDNVECTGRESDISECRHKPWGEHNCGHNEDVTIGCTNHGGHIDHRTTDRPDPWRPTDCRPPWERTTPRPPHPRYASMYDLHRLSMKVREAFRMMYQGFQEGITDAMRRLHR